MTQFAIGPVLTASADVAGDQRASDATRLTSGNYVISGQGVFDPNGRPLSHNIGPGGSVTALADGGFAVVLRSSSAEGYAIKFYDEDGTPRPGPINFSADEASGAGGLIAATTLIDGRLAVAWSEIDNTSGFRNYMTVGRILNADGTAATDKVQFGPSSGPGSEHGYIDLDLTPLANGGFALLRGRDDYVNVLAFRSAGVGEAQLFDADGHATTNVIALSGVASLVSASTLPDGRVVAGYESGFSVIGTDGVRSETHNLTFGYTPRGFTNPVEVAALPDGNILVTYGQYATPTTKTVAAIYTPDGVSVGLPIQDVEYKIPVVLSQDKFVFVGTQFAHPSNVDGKTLPYGSGADVLSRIVTATFATSDADGTPLVNDAFYLARNGDVASAGQDPDQHYHLYGWQEGRDPNALFNTDAYRSLNTDVRTAQIDPLQHYHEYGWREGRDPSASFDTQFYLANNADVRAAGIDPFEHYLQYGRAEGREISAAITQGGINHGSFDPGFYLLSNVDVAKAAAAAGGDTFEFAYQHYQTYGWQEGRNPNAFFDTKGYLSLYTDVAAAKIDPLAHYDQYGWQEGRDPSALFDTTNYLTANNDVAGEGINPLKHFLEYGVVEGRLGLGDGLLG